MATVIPLRQTPKWAKRRKPAAYPAAQSATRTREHLTPDEVQRMITTARRSADVWPTETRY